MVDFELIQRALDEAVSDAEELYNRRKVEYAGYEKSGKVAAYADAMVEAQKARAEFNALRRAMEWQPIETAPKDGTRIALRFASGFEGEGNYQPTNGGEWHVKSFKHLPWANTPTHWMPLPPPPKVEE